MIITKCGRWVAIFIFFSNNSYIKAYKGNNCKPCETNYCVSYFCVSKFLNLCVSFLSPCESLTLLRKDETISKRLRKSDKFFKEALSRLRIASSAVFAEPFDDVFSASLFQEHFSSLCKNAQGNVCDAKEAGRKRRRRQSREKEKRLDENILYERLAPCPWPPIVASRL